MSADRDLIKCYSLVLANKFEREDNGAFSLVNLLDGVKVARATQGLIAPGVAVSHWMFGENWRDKTLEFHLSLQPSNGEPATNAPPATIRLGFDDNIYDDGYVRLKIIVVGFPIPNSFGTFKAIMRWRQSSTSDWVDGEAQWWVSLAELTGSPPKGDKVLEAGTPITAQI
jgi:hypothetical protein